MQNISGIYVYIYTTSRRHGSAAGGVWGCGVLFAGVDSVVGANACASAAIDAGIGVDVIDFAFRDSAYGALGEAGAACYTCVGNYVCHNCNFLFGKNIYVVVCWCKFNSFFCISQSLTAKIACQCRVAALATYALVRYAMVRPVNGLQPHGLRISLSSTVYSSDGLMTVMSAGCPTARVP